MPLDISPVVTTLLASGAFEAHSSLDVVLSDATEIHIATANFTGVTTNSFGPQDYTADLRESGSLTQSMTLSTDRIDLSAQNIASYIGDGFVIAGTLNGAAAILSTIFTDDNGINYQVEILHGSITNASEEDALTKFQLVSYLCLSGPVGGFRTLQKHCSWRYKHPGCDSLSTLATCDHTFDGNNGCPKHTAAARITTPPSPDNTPSYGGFVFKSPTAPGSIATDTASIDDNTDFNSYSADRERGYTGRYQVPQEQYSR